MEVQRFLSLKSVFTWKKTHPYTNSPGKMGIFVFRPQWTDFNKKWEVLEAETGENPLDIYLDQLVLRSQGARKCEETIILAKKKNSHQTEK